MFKPLDPLNPFTPEEEQYYRELAEKSRYHSAERAKLAPHLKHYRDWKCLMNETGRPDLHPFTPEEEARYREMAEQSAYHFEEIHQCQMALGPYRDLKNVLAYAEQEGYRKGVKKGRRKVALQAAKESLKENLSVSLIADFTGLSETEIESLQQTSG